VKRAVGSGLLVVLTAIGCQSEPPTNVAYGPEVELEGAGATFPAPLYSRWIASYSQLHPEVHIAYDPIGTGAGLRALREGTVDFAGAETWPAPEESGALDAVAVPATMGAVAIAYNLPGLATGVRLTPELIGAIFAGDIRRWDDSRLRAVNPGVELPPAVIQVVHRADGSGTTAVFTEYLSQVVPWWRDRIGQGIRVPFPTGRAVQASEGVAGWIRSTPYTIGYVQLGHALRVELSLAAVRNHAGRFVVPSLDTVASAARHPKPPQPGRIVLLDAEGVGSYPIAAYSYLVVPRHPNESGHAAALLEFLRWCLEQGQREAPSVSYAPLPSDAMAAARQGIQQLQMRQPQNE
jgi:phosphate transport system substrate-binding protein